MITQRCPQNPADINVIQVISSKQFEEAFKRTQTPQISAKVFEIWEYLWVLRVVFFLIVNDFA